MKKIMMIGITALFVLFILSRQLPVSAQGMMGFFNSSSDNTAVQNQQAEEQTGKKFIDGLNNKTISCTQLSDADFEKIGEYFMGQSIGNTQRHIVMNDMMKRMMGEKGEEQAHEAMGKRYSGCDTTAAFPTQDNGFLPMMGMLGMMGGNNQWEGGGYSMMNNFGYGGGWLFMLLWWLFVIAIIVVIAKWIFGQRGITTNNAKEILKERYAKGEITKKEFEEMKKIIN